MKAPANVTLAEFQSLVRTIASERPNFRYRTNGSQSCRYAPSIRPDGSESRCLIGEALHRLGHTDEELRDLDEAKSSAADNVLPGLGYSADVADWARAVQAKQDTGRPWGECIPKVQIYNLDVAEPLAPEGIVEVLDRLLSEGCVSSALHGRAVLGVSELRRDALRAQVLDPQAHHMDAPGGPRCACGLPSAHESGACRRCRQVERLTAEVQAWRAADAGRDFLLEGRARQQARALRAENERRERSQT